MFPPVRLIADCSVLLPLSSGTEQEQVCASTQQTQGQHEDLLLFTNIISKLIYSRRFTNHLPTCQPSQVFIRARFTIWVLGVWDLCICLLFIKKDSFKPTYSKAIR